MYHIPVKPYFLIYSSLLGGDTEPSCLDRSRFPTRVQAPRYATPLRLFLSVPGLGAQDLGGPLDFLQKGTETELLKALTQPYPKTYTIHSLRLSRHINIIHYAASLLGTPGSPCDSSTSILLLKRICVLQQ